MNLVKLFSAYSILGLISLFLFSNTMKLGAGTGYIYLALIVIPLSLLLITTKNNFNLLKIKPSMLLLALFLTYLITHYLIDTMNLRELKAVTVSTTGGMIFALILGMIGSYAISSIYKLRYSQKTILPAFLLGLGYILLTISLTKDSLAFHLSDILSDFFLIENQEGYYQRVGNFFFIQFMLTGAVIVVLLMTFTKQFRFLKRFSLLVLYTVSAFFYAITSQLIGSNSGFAASVGFLIVFYIYFFVLISRDKTSKHQNIKISSLIFGALGKQIIQGIGVLILVFIAVTYYINQTMNIDFSRFRASGFGSGGSNSIDERIKLFKNNFIEHFSYNPVFGNVQVEVLTTGEGTYVHSLPFSLITHTGIVGFILFTLLLGVIYKEIVFSRAHPNINSLNANKNYGLFRLFALTSVLVLGSISAHFIWIPLWFAIGLFGLSFVEKTSFKNE